jgi:F-type H+-transporting ATPase subunit b
LDLDWSTFVLEIINFLVLVWILKRFLYQPILDVIAARRKSIEDQLAEAHSIEAEAKALKEQYTGRLSEWEAEKRQAREELTHEIDRERSRRMSDMQSAIDQEKEKASVAEARRQAEQQRAFEQQALLQGAEFSTRLLEQAAGPALEDRLLNLLIDDLNSLPKERRTHLREQWAGSSEAVAVSSAFDLSDAQRERVVGALKEVGGISSPVNFLRDEQLVAGLRIVIGSWVLAANIRDELKGFTELAHAPH